LSPPRKQVSSSHDLMSIPSDVTLGCTEEPALPRGIESPVPMHMSRGGSQRHVVIREYDKPSMLCARTDICLKAGTVPPPGPEALETRGPRLDDSDDFDARKFPEVQRLASLGREHSVGNRRERRLSEGGRVVSKARRRDSIVSRGRTSPRRVAKPSRLVIDDSLKLSQAPATRRFDLRRVSHHSGPCLVTAKTGHVKRNIVLPVRALQGVSVLFVVHGIQIDMKRSQ